MKVLTTSQLSANSKNRQSPATVSPAANALSTLTTDMLFLQRKVGCACGGGCPNCREDTLIQPKLRIGRPNDKYEQEADHVADQVMPMPDTAVQRQPEEELVQTRPLISPLVQCQAENGEEEEELIQPKVNRAHTTAVNPQIASCIHSLKGGGQPLPVSIRRFFEPRFGRDFSRVRVHRGSLAAATAQAVQARAFTLGSDVVFGPGQYAPETEAGKRLLAHELTHTIQQQTAMKNIIWRQARPEDSGPGSLPQPPNVFTFDVFDPLNSRLRIQGFTLPSPRNILNGLDALRRFLRPGGSTSPPSSLPMQPLQLTDEQIRQITCRMLPNLCQTQSIQPTFPAIPTIPPLTLPRLQIPRIIFVERQIYDHFVYDRSGIPDRHRLKIDQTATRMIDHPAFVADIYGHTDSRGPRQYNLRLSRRRARAVRDHLIERQVPRSQIWSVTGYGETQPRYPNDAIDHLAASRNRRVELKLSRLSWNLRLFPDLSLRLPPTPTLGIRDPRPRVLPAQRNMYNTLRDFLIQVRTGINRLLAAPPAGEAWVRRDNENITQMLERLDTLIANLRNERHVVRFNLPAGGRVAASYSVLEDLVRLRPFATNQARNEVAASLIHEFAHFVQDVTVEQLQRAARLPIEHTREDELRQETESRRHEVYFTRLMNLLGHRVGFHAELSARVFLNRFERVRTGSPTDQAAARTEIRQSIETAYATQLAANAPSRRYLIEIRSNRHAILIRSRNAETDLGAVPTRITTRSQLNYHLLTQIRASPIRPSLFQDSNGTRYVVIIFLVFDAGRKVAEFGDMP